MTFAEFHHALRIMRGFEFSELVAAGVLPSAEPPDGFRGQRFDAAAVQLHQVDEWRRFEQNPYAWFIRTDDERARKLFALIQAKMAPSVPEGQVNPEFWRAVARAEKVARAERPTDLAQPRCVIGPHGIHPLMDDAFGNRGVYMRALNDFVQKSEQYLWSLIDQGCRFLPIINPMVIVKNDRTCVTIEAQITGWWRITDEELQAAQSLRRVPAGEAV